MNLPRACAAVACAATAFMSFPAMAAATVYFGEDLGAAGPGNMPNSRAAQAQFVGALAGTGVEGFEFWGGTLEFHGTSITAELTSGEVRDDNFDGRFAVNGSQYLINSFNQRITFSAPVVAFGTYVTDANERDNDPDTVTVNGLKLTPEQIAARPFDSVDGIFRIVAERSPGNFEVLFDSGTFPAADSSAMFVGVVDAANPYTNIILINGTSGLDEAFQDGFGYDDMTVALAVPEPGTWGLMMLGAFCVLRATRARA